MIVALTGASGVVGRFVAADLLARGVVVRAWSRRDTDRSGFTGPVEWIEGELGSSSGAAALVESVDAVVHCALDHTKGHYRGGEGIDLEAFVRNNVQGSLALMCAARRAGVARFVFLSSRAVYGDRRDEASLDEHDHCLPDSHYGAVKRAVESFVQSFGLGEGWGASALRATGVYGITWPTHRTKWLPLARTLLAGKAWTGPLGGTEVHGADLAQAVWALLTAGVAGQLYNCSDRYVSTREVAMHMQRHGGLTGPLPDAPPSAPRRVLACARLERLGVRFGGEALLRTTAAQILDLAREEGP
jgi:nucleoside-diphosphate-sugar epimerase